MCSYTCSVRGKRPNDFMDSLSHASCTLKFYRCCPFWAGCFQKSRVNIVSWLSMPCYSESRSGENKPRTRVGGLTVSAFGFRAFGSFADYFILHLMYRSTSSVDIHVAGLVAFFLKIISYNFSLIARCLRERF